MNSIVDTITKSLLYDEQYARKVLPYLDESYFEGYYKTIFTMYKTMYDKHNKIPNLDMFAVLLEKSSIQEQEFNEIIEALTLAHKNRKDLPDTDFLVKETEEYCRDKKIYEAIHRAMNIIEGDDKEYDKSALPSLLEDAISISFDHTMGMEYFDDAESRWELYTAEDSRIPFPLHALNKLSNGGHKKKSLSCILAGTNVGKSAMMGYLAGAFTQRGLNVVYFTLEMAEEDVHERIDANLLGVPTDKIKDLTKQEYLKKIKTVKEKTTGKLYVKEYPTGSAHVGHFRTFLRDLKQKKKVIPDFIFVDYINIMASSRYKPSGVNSYTYIKAIAEELRGLSMELNIPIMTATQVNRVGMDSKSPDMTDTSDSFGLPMSLDFFIALSQDEVLKENNQQLVTCIKTRWGNKSKVVSQLVRIDWDLMRYYDVDAMNSKSVAQSVGQNKPPEKKQKSKNKSLDDIDWN